MVPRFGLVAVTPHVTNIKALTGLWIFWNSYLRPKHEKSTVCKKQGRPALIGHLFISSSASFVLKYGRSTWLFQQSSNCAQLIYMDVILRSFNECLLSLKQSTTATVKAQKKEKLSGQTQPASPSNTTAITLTWFLVIYIYIFISVPLHTEKACGKLNNCLNDSLSPAVNQTAVSHLVQLSPTANTKDLIQCYYYCCCRSV